MKNKQKHLCHMRLLVRDAYLHHVMKKEHTQ